MPRFYLHLCDSGDFLKDDEGSELTDAAVARQTAISEARSIMASDLRTGTLDLSAFIEVDDENRKYLFTVHFADAIKVKGGDLRATGGGREGQTLQ
ncbi:DUF6894 family protein [Allosphingosinicella indica]|uniref:DUF6894 domain-containing protein n=1 Tax=Allosphingosinicella indica TaxID=941907 RepID=A0A1X7FYH6_9SPHN|nr:hypothetical protein [Allosphingosinicella indica]SMF61117.1 hypothetical protein SAMN06295910_0130 [Allosphingosinicella indica]